jgi:hypothetical protein
MSSRSATAGLLELTEGPLHLIFKGESKGHERQSRTPCVNGTALARSLDEVKRNPGDPPRIPLTFHPGYMLHAGLRLTAQGSLRRP